jgi:hypothetical protein
LKGVQHEPTYLLRRFSGGANLERGRYYALLDHGIATNTSTLAAELLAYSHSDSGDWTSIFDLRGYPPTAFQNVMSQAQLERVVEKEGHVIAVFDRPFVWEASDDRTPRQAGYLFPYRIETIARQRALDLRRPEALDWLIHSLNEDFPNAVFVAVKDEYELISYRRQRGPRVLVVKNQGSPQGRRELLKHLEDDGFGKDTKLGLHGLGLELRGVHDLLPYLLNQTFGGTPITDIIACYSQECGAECVVFPSARTNCGVRYEGGEVAAYWGWNLVDFAGAQRAEHIGDLYSLWHPQYYATSLEATINVMPLEGRDAYPASVKDQLAGWAVEGLAQANNNRVHLPRWERYLEQNFQDLDLGNVLVERTPRRGILGRYERHPRVYERLFDLRVAIINQETRLECRVLSIHGEPRDMRLGDYLAVLCTEVSALAKEPAPTVYAGSWFLLQSLEPAAFILLCPCCGSQALFRTIEIERYAWCERCRYGAVAGESQMEAGARAFAAIDEGLDQLRPL